VFGLQRAFHLAGARNVVASLWKVEDDATAALMKLFYTHLWQTELPPIEALRRAQVTIDRHPELIESLSAGRGIGVTEPAKLPGAAAVKSEIKTAPPRQWAAFVLSGAGD
jgi:CHAT domain-containing protein